MAEEAEAYILNHGRAEEIFMMRPDLVIAGSFTTRATVEMLRRLGFRVEEFAPASSFADIRENLRRMGDLLGRRKRRKNWSNDWTQACAVLPATLNAVPWPQSTMPTATQAAAGPWRTRRSKRQASTTSPKRLGYSGTSQIAAGGAGEGSAGHCDRGTALRDGRDAPMTILYIRRSRPDPIGGAPFSVPDKYWICGTPFTADAVRILANIAAEASE